jgi:hypothetical protein
MGSIGIAADVSDVDSDGLQSQFGGLEGSIVFGTLTLTLKMH